MKLSSPYLHEQAGELLTAAIPSLRYLRISGISLSSGPRLSVSDHDSFHREGDASERFEQDALEREFPPPLFLKGWANVPKEGLELDDVRGGVVVVDFWGLGVAHVLPSSQS